MSDFQTSMKSAIEFVGTENQPSEAEVPRIGRHKTRNRDNSVCFTQILSYFIRRDILRISNEERQFKILKTLLIDYSK